MPESWQRWYPHDINDWNGSAAVRSFTDAAYRAYHTLLMAQFEQDDGMLPNDPRKLAKLSGMGVRWQEPRAGYPTIAEEVMEEFESGPDDKVYNPRMYKEWLRARKVFEKRSNGGKRKSLPRVIEESSKSLGTVLPKNTEKPEESTTHIQRQRQRQEQNTNTPPSRTRDVGPPEPPSPEAGPEWGENAPPPGMPMLAYSRGMLETLCIPLVMATEQAGAAAIGAFAKERGLEKHLATAELTRTARDALDRGEQVDKWWFTDSKWRKKQEAAGGSNSTNRAQERVEQSRGAFRKAAERRGIRGIDGFAGPDGGELSPPGPAG